MAGRRVGIDTGGTFTDAIAADGAGGFQVAKVPTTPRAPAAAVLTALQRLAPAGGGPVDLVHGTTHATNALLTGRLGRVVLVVTRGFADLLAIGRQERARLYDLEPRPPRPNLPRSRVVEVRERLDAAGRVLEELTTAEVERAAAEVAKRRPEAVAVLLLHAWRQPRHERRLGRALRRLGVPVVLSSEVAPEVREYERGVTTWADAGLRPVVGPALRLLDLALTEGWGPGSCLRVMRSDGGTCEAAAAAERPVNLALSGPAGGLAAARSLADARGDGAVLTLDMGGTSTDVALLPAGEPPLAPIGVAGLPLLCRGLPLHTVGTGGGSLARPDAGGALRVGPDSAGAEPGPACYGRGGARATVTDAHLVAGRLHPEEFLGGEFPLRPERAEAALAELGRAFGLEPTAAAQALLEVATTGMERALRRVSLAEGHDPRGLALYAFGGAGGLHAAWLADRLGMARVVVPPFAGVFSALGLLAAPPRRTFARSVLAPLPAAAERRRLFAPLVERARAELRAEGVAASRIRLRRVLELRGEGQAGGFALPEGPDPLGRFHAEHERRFGYARRDRPVLLDAVRVQADGPVVSPWRPRRLRRRTAQPRFFAAAHLPETGAGRRRCGWYRREELAPGDRLAGPAVVAEYSGTTVVPPGWRARVGRFGELVLEVKR
ncbi:MAG: hydantoinase/oxoprolinase family protein [Planctomycetota bacterium]|nr:MAG: hydantoinase/oxoprolinase family protein [Planctomycetota bacterium]